MARPYHHGDLRRALLDAAVEAIEGAGPAELSLRDLARRIGVSHAAPAHHFGDKAGLLTALATEGYALLGEELATTWERTHDFLEVGVAYVRFAVAHRAHFEVMYRPELHRADDPALTAAREATASLLYGSAETTGAASGLEAGVAGWSLMHGVAWLWMNRALPGQLGDDPEQIARTIGAYLFGPPPSGDPTT